MRILPAVMRIRQGTWGVLIHVDCQASFDDWKHNGGPVLRSYRAGGRYYLRGQRGIEWPVLQYHRCPDRLWRFPNSSRRSTVFHAATRPVVPATKRVHLAWGARWAMLAACLLVPLHWVTMLG